MSIEHAKLNGSVSVRAKPESVVLLGANSARAQAMFYNRSTRTLYMNFGKAATMKDWVVLLEPNDYYELPSPVYAGEIFGVWADGVKGFCRVTELVR